MIPPQPPVHTLAKRDQDRQPAGSVPKRDFARAWLIAQRNQLTAITRKKPVDLDWTFASNPPTPKECLKYRAHKNFPQRKSGCQSTLL